MKYFKYLKEHAGWIIIWFFLIVTIEIFLMTAGRNAGFISGTAFKLFTAAAVTCGILLGTYLDFRKVRRFLENLDNSAASLDKKYLLPEVVGQGTTQEERLVVAILGQMEQSMADNVQEHRRLGNEYREYIETWVHEVKVPIATAGMIIENHKDEKVGEVELSTEITRIRNYVEQALFFARSEAVEKDYIIKKMDLEEIVSSVIYDKKRILREKRASINIHDLDVSSEVLSDGKWISFIIGQIVDNSIKYSAEGRSLALEIWADTRDSRVCLHIKDNGVGMKSSEMGRIFDKGFTGTNGRNISASTGMGLYLCKKLCTRLEHELTTQSVEGQGTEMMILF